MTDKVSDNGKRTRRRKGERADGRIVRTLKIGNNPDGTPDRKFFYGRTVAEAEKKRDEFKALLTTGFVRSLDKITVRDWVKEYQASYDMRGEYSPYVDRLVNELGSIQMTEIRHLHLQRSLNRFVGKSSSGAIKHRMVLKRVFRSAFKNKVIVDDPSEDLTIPDGTVDGSHRALEPWEAKLIYENWHESDYGLWYLTFYATGIRRSEGVALDWSRIDLKNRGIIINQAASYKSNQAIIKDTTKTLAGERIVPIPEQLLIALEQVPKAQRKGFLMTVDGEPLSLKSLRSSLNAFCKVLEQVHNNEPVDVMRQPATTKKIRKEIHKQTGHIFQPFKFRLHDLRHTYATALYDAGVDIKTAQYLLGHKDIKTTLKLYTHLSVKRKMQAFSDFNEHLNSLHTMDFAAPGKDLISATSSQKVVSIDSIMDFYTDNQPKSHVIDE